ncbi:Eco57I restriction-modification methylase domain-containing protein [Gilvimarinus agarilyticus]|uniref:Eco57I restriction-modification methylase domain-containing protein n=1 Tax=Gilvimarinus agarilyticus TaxID=679259 RepID=UPI0006973703|nr:N-6 DNA methylase [Gilvimarinus agarilyticus]
MANTTQQNFDAIRVVGGLLGSKILQDARLYSLPGQSQQDYSIERGLTFNDEIGRYWRIAQGRWREFQQQRQREDVNLHAITVNDWLLPLLERVLGYSVTPCQHKQTLGEREFPITHQAWGRSLPLVLCSADQDLDKSDNRYGQEGRKRSPMGLAQEYLNAESQCLWSLVSNGLVLRLLRDNPAMTRPAYVEVDFTRLFDEDNYADFAALWLLLHASRVEPHKGQPEHCWLEQWRERGHDEGERALDKLRYGVADALRQLGTGFLAHPANTGLRQKLASDELSTDAYFQQVLRLVYRFLFLLTAEDRDVVLLPRDYDGEDHQVARDLYQAGYSITRLRERARQRRHYDHHGDAWQQLCVTFTGFASGQPLLAQPALGGLFAHDQCPDLASSQLANRYLYSALFNLCYFEHQGILARINYRDMDTEEFGSVYESLLELIPQIHPDGQWGFSFIGDADDESAASGHSRKLTGSYYTPDSLVQELIKSALEPVIANRLKANPQQPRQALLGISVCDPACGSGHFLLAAARRLATELAQIDAGSDQATEHHYRHALRDVVRHCIYGVDLNPMAVELCKTGLWLESIEPGKPLSFLDAHVQCGNALVGILNPEQLEKGIPADAYKPLSGDDKSLCSELKKQNAQAIKKSKHGEKLAVSLRVIPQTFKQLEAMPEDTVSQIEAKRRAFTEARAGQDYQNDRLKEDLFTAAFFAPKTAETAKQVPTNNHLKLAAEGHSLPGGVRDLTRELANTHRFFHWPLAFPQVFGEGAPGGFDVMLGNPPWERIKLQEQEFFASRAPDIATAQNAAVRGRMIQALAESSNPNQKNLYRRFMQAKQGAEGSSAFARLSGRFPLTGRGDVNLYALFAEHFAKGINSEGRSGVIVPTGIATDDSTKYFFGWLAEGKRLASLYDFENREGIFKSVHRSYKFCLLTTGNNISAADLSFFSTQPSQLADKRRHFTLSAEEFSLINPNTKTCPVFRAQKDAEITKKIYRAAPVLIREADEHHPEINPWGIRFQAMFHMSNDSRLFKGLSDLEPDQQGYLPLYEAKMVHHYDHRWATYETDGETSRDCTLAEKQNPHYQSRPRYWVPENEVTLRTAQAPKAVLDACKKADNELLYAALSSWCAGAFLQQNQTATAEALFGEPLRSEGKDLFDSGLTATAQAAVAMQEDFPLTAEEQTRLKAALEQQQELWQQVWPLLEARRPKYLLGWRDICRSTDERTVIAGVIPLSGVGNNMPLILFNKFNAINAALLQANLTSLPFDFIARHKVGGTHLNFFIIKQLPVLPPSAFDENDEAFIIPRVLELTYTEERLKSFAEDLGYHGEPFAFDPDRRHQLKCELDAYYAKLYGLNEEELRYILDPTEVMGDDYPSETFRGLKNKDIKAYGKYLTQERVLAAWEELHKEDANQQYAPYRGAAYSPQGVIRNEQEAQIAGLLLLVIRQYQFIPRTKLNDFFSLIGTDISDDSESLKTAAPELIQAAHLMESEHRWSLVLDYLQRHSLIRAEAEGYRSLAGNELPQDVVVIDELQDLAMRLQRIVTSWSEQSSEERTGSLNERGENKQA